jgi:hypothetical protein
MLLNPLNEPLDFKAVRDRAYLSGEPEANAWHPLQLMQVVHYVRNSNRKQT